MALRAPGPSARPCPSVKTVVLSQSDPRHGPYGIDILPRYGYDITGVPPVKGALRRKVRDVVEHRSGVLVDIPVRSIPAAGRAELVIGLLEPVTRLAAALKRRRIPPYSSVPVVMVSCWLAEWIRTSAPDARRELVDAFSPLDLILTLSRNQVDILLDAGFREDQVDAIPFGCAPGLFSGPDVDRDLDVVAAGFDHGRDYRTFFDGVASLDAQVHLLCQPANLAGLDVPSNVVLHGVVPYGEYRVLLRRAKIVAVPTKELAYPTGQSVALDACAAGAALAFTGTVPLLEYFDETCAAPVAPLDSAGWTTTLRSLLGDDAGRGRLAAAGHERVLERFTYDHMWGAFRDRLASRGLPTPSRPWRHAAADAPGP